eukprot:1852232-Rhodomonas_salina.1
MEGLSVTAQGGSREIARVGTCCLERGVGGCDCLLRPMGAKAFSGSRVNSLVLFRNARAGVSRLFRLCALLCEVKLERWRSPYSLYREDG